METVLRKLAAILLMLILLFNIGGYRIALSLLQNSSDSRLETQIDNREYDESSLVEIRVSLNMPYQERFTEFERHYGEINIDGKSYTYVMRKIEGHEVIFKCIANESKEQIRTIHNDMAKANSAIDMNNSSQKHNSSVAKNFWSEYENHHSLQPVLSAMITSSPQKACYGFFLPEFAGNTPHQPPETWAVIS